MSRRRNIIRNERGQTMVEFALVVPILCLVLFGILQFGALYNDYVTLDRRRARRSPEGSCQPPCDEPVRRPSPRPPPATQPPGLEPTDLDIDVSSTAGSAANPVTVTATYPYAVDLLGIVVASGNLESEINGACGMNRLRNERGQAAVLSVVFIAALLGAIALVLDVGSWFRAQRATQSAADAAALAGSSGAAREHRFRHGDWQRSISRRTAAGRRDHVLEQNVANDTINVDVTLNATPRSIRQDLRNRLGRGARARRVRARGARQCPGAAPIAVDKASIRC